LPTPLGLISESRPTIQPQDRSLSGNPTVYEYRSKPSGVLPNRRRSAFHAT
jgi:hypothetical protein